MMKVVSVNAGLPRQVVSAGRTVSTGIYKTPVAGRIKVRRLNLEGDGQADLTVHGGPNKAVYAYPTEHYAFWHAELPGMELAWGMFGENLTLEGLLEADANIGDQFQIGTAILMVRQPRLPCYKLGIKFGRDEMIERFLHSRRTGFYLSVVQEGELGTGEALTRILIDVNQVSISDLLHLHLDPKDSGPDEIRRALQVPALPPGWRKRLEERLRDFDGRSP
jgi:MOSC domain-containing protein YiiM